MSNIYSNTTEFWYLDSPDSTAFRAAWDEDMDFVSGERCQVNPQHLPMLGRNKDLSVVLPNRSVKDFVWTWFNELLVQEHVLEMFREQGFAGFETKPVQARFSARKSASPAKKPPRLWEIVVTGWGGLAPEEAEIKILEKCLGCGRTIFAMAARPEWVIDREQWDGSDFFRVWPYVHARLVTDRVAQAIRASKFIGTALRDPVGSMRANQASDTLTPARLSYYMPMQHAKRIGEMYGLPY